MKVDIIIFEVLAIYLSVGTILMLVDCFLQGFSGKDVSWRSLSLIVSWPMFIAHLLGALCRLLVSLTKGKK